MKLLTPDLIAQQLADIDLQHWYAKGIRCILVDLDNTISPWNELRVTEDAERFIKDAREKDITIALFTNAPEERSREAAWHVGVAYFASAKKPFQPAYRKALAELHYKNTEVMAVGDQLFTDILGGNLAGFTTVLVPPLSEREFTGTKILRFMERVFLGRSCFGKGKRPAQ
jgi:HAD superfamily phosphatase (TIGR01668 family)